MFTLHTLDVWWAASAPIVLLSLYYFTQGLYSLSFLVDGYLFSRPVNMIDMGEKADLVEGFKEGLSRDRPVLPGSGRAGIGHAHDHDCAGRAGVSKGSLSRHRDPQRQRLGDDCRLKNLQEEFPFLELLEVPSTDHRSWQPVWNAWDNNPKAYWWHQGENAYNEDLPPKKTRQLIYAFYNWMMTNPEPGTLISYTDADSCPPKDHFWQQPLAVGSTGSCRPRTSPVTPV